MCRSSSFIVLMFLLVVVVAAVMGREILIDDDSPVVVKTNAVTEAGETDETVGSSVCHMEYQVVKRVVGRCIKLGRAARGCVAGNYLHPFHPECM
ncbi:PREDICTED: uncharacterized protein LOC108567796 isoform X1 [Nicrophorus vespilloides]|uniref:Uncharacterized protein LOC108567796 isoform X1 n=1 Tax=Nicrophorus vespilloides TaxID=110193 RepID=A0ABM1NAW3_NICVS|nr:PREDICTED: uncharacterized protein LOC108567796 isoform X1 [Nicrophorus vespilloides]